MSIAKLSPAQQAAVECVSCPTIVTAGAGSGKTRTLTSKIAFLVKENGIQPHRILAITFTNKAAAEMKGRLAQATGRPVKEFPWVRTFHSACFRILKTHCELLGYEKPLLIHDESQQKGHLKKVLADLNLDKKYLNAAASMISNAKNSGDPHSYLAANGRVPRKLEVYRLYNEMLERHNSVDFDDILMLTRALLKKHTDIRVMYQDAFDYILIDEFQDSNGIQNHIVDLLLRNGNLTVVGDDYQSIYRFRGADPFHFINFPKKYSNAQIFRLEENYRSTTQIVAASDALIAHNLHRIEKNCFSKRPGDPVHFRKFRDEEKEATWVAGRCREYLDSRRISVADIAILYRTKFTSLHFERALRLAKLPYTMVGAQGFYQRREVQDINCYLVCAVNPKDDLSFERIINIPRRGVGPAVMKKILAAKDKDTSLQEACWKALRGNVLPKKAAVEIEKLLLFLKSVGQEKPAAVMNRVMRDMNYGEYLEGFAENKEDEASRLENIRQMIYDASQKETIADYLEDAALIRDDQDNADNQNGIRLSTIHAAKGLEFKAVFVVALEEGLLPHHRSLYSGEQDESDEGIEEERRLMYVAMTRAADTLNLTCSATRRGEPTFPSRFLGEIPKEFLR